MIFFFYSGLSAKATQSSAGRMQAVTGRVGAKKVRIEETENSIASLPYLKKIKKSRDPPRFWAKFVNKMQ